MNWYGGYTLDLYCDYGDERHLRESYAQVVTGQTREAAFREARRLGWSIVGRKGGYTCRCPAHRGKRLGRAAEGGGA